MRKYVCVCLLGTVFLAGQVHADDQMLLKTQKDKVSYGIGFDMIKNFKKQGIEADLELVIKGMRDSASGAKSLISDAEMKKSLADYQMELAGKQAELKVLAAEKNKREGDAYLKSNKKKNGVVTLPSGLQYKIIKAGTGIKPTDADNVTCRYRGTLVDGTEFDSSERLGYPLTFNVKDSIVKGWSDALKLMPAGSKWLIAVPPELGYGEKGAGRDIGPNATLLYEIELIAVNAVAAPVIKKETK
jgi:FKBP-type peptidyl-prolyl cis-trans isomerase FklB